MSVLLGFLPSALMVATAVAAIIPPAAAHGAEGKPIVMITSQDAGPYQDVLTGFRTYLTDRGVEGPFVVHSLQRDAGQATEALSVARREGAGPLLTVGSVATQAALKVTGEAPIIACMIVNAHDLQKAPNATGVVLEFPFDTQFQWMKRFVPKSKTIGVLYNPKENRSQIDAAAKVARSLGLRLVAREIERPQDLPDALDGLAKEADLLWGVTDQLVLSPKTAEAILLFSFRNRIPFTGLSASWVKAGALYALDRDYLDLGAQCGEMAFKVLNGTPASSLPPATPRKVTFALNLRTAEHMKLEFSPALINGAEQVFH